jgi:uncharacterized protein YcbK (DUF882 family)
MRPFDNIKFIMWRYDSGLMQGLSDNGAATTRIAMAAILAGLLLPVNQAYSIGERTLSFFHTHTGKSLEVTFSSGGEYVGTELVKVNAFLSDFRTGDAIEIDPELLDLIYEVRASLGSSETYEVISAYRSPKTNEMLRGKSSGVASNSQHLYGRAIDVRLRGVDTSELRDAAIELQRGGVGYYKESDFVHVDTGRVRRW